MISEGQGELEQLKKYFLFWKGTSQLSVKVLNSGSSHQLYQHSQATCAVMASHLEWPRRKRLDSHIICSYAILYMGNIWLRKILVNHTSESYWWGKAWGINYSQCISKYILVYLSIRWGKLSQITHDSPIFPYQNFPV